MGAVENRLGRVGLHQNSGEFPDVETLTIEWVGLIPGKRESRRFIGNTLLCQQDIIKQRDHYDAVAYSKLGLSTCIQPMAYTARMTAVASFIAKGTYTIPFRTLYSLLTGRLISATHVAFGTAHVMCTCGVLGEAVGRAAALCHQLRITPQQLAQPETIPLLQKRLLRQGAFIPCQRLDDPAKAASD